MPAALQRLAESWGAGGSGARSQLLAMVQGGGGGTWVEAAGALGTDGEEMMADLRVAAVTDGPMKSVSTHD